MTGATGPWIPLESNPDVMNKYLRLLGVRSSLQFCDVFSLDDEMLQYIPQPVKAVVLLFPITEKYEAFRKAEEERIKTNGQIVSDKVFFVRQTIGNACGTIGLLHALGNNQESLDLEDKGALNKILQRCSSKKPDERAKVLEQDDDLATIHKASSLEGDTEAPDAEEDVDLHFVCFIEKDGHIYEMDGRKPFPINHGASTGDFLQDAVKVVRSFIDREPDNNNFTVIALAPADSS